MKPYIIHAYKLLGDGHGHPVSGEALTDSLESDDLAWVHLDVNFPESRAWLEREITYLDPFIIHALLEDETRPRVTQINDGVLIVLRGVNFNEGANREDMVSVRMFIDSHRIISLEKRPVRAVRDISDALVAGTGPKNSSEFIVQILSKLTEPFQTVLYELDEVTDNTEEAILTTVDATLRADIIDIRKKSIVYRRHLAPQRDAVAILRTADLTWLTDMDRRVLLEKYNHVVRYVEELDAIRERAQIVKDELANLISDRLNRNTYVLSVIAAIFLPLGFLTGLLGINIGGLPGVENGNAFLIFCVMLCVLVACQIYIFKKLKWF